jgi:hypothetical protein
MMLERSAQWRRNAENWRQTAAQCLKEASNGGAMVIISAQWWWDAEFERWMVAWCFKFAPNGWWRDASILHPMAGAMLGKGLKAESGQWYAPISTNNILTSACWRDKEIWALVGANDDTRPLAWMMRCWAPAGANDGMLSARRRKQWYAQGLTWAPDGSAKLIIKALWWRKAKNEHPMTAQSWNLAPDGSGRLNMSTWWQSKAEN